MSLMRLLQSKALWLSVSVAVIAGACGGRTALKIPPPLPPLPPCVVDSDCPGFDDLCNPVACQYPEPDAGDAGVPTGGQCVLLEPVDCDDNDPCTRDECDWPTGVCLYSIATLDSDGDGYRGPLTGKLPGEPGSCGDDCNDASALSHPGGIEVCDGVDNDCNGIVDDNASFLPLAKEPVRISGDIAPSGPGGLAFSGTSYASVYSGTTDGFDMYLSMLDPAGQVLPPGESLVTLAYADASGGPVVWVGDRYGLAWQDRRDSDYEVYFTLLDKNGAKVLADTRLSNAYGFSVNVSLGWTGNEFVAVWQDEREGQFNLYGQRLSVDGALIGDNVALTTTSEFGFPNEAPSVAAGVKSLGIAWGLGDAYSHLIQFQTFTPELGEIGPPLLLTDGSTEAVYPTAIWNKDRYIIAWYDKSASPKAIYAAAVDEDGTLLVPATAISNPGTFHSRYPYMRALGDRVLFLYADDRDQNDGYELYSRMMTSSLAPISDEQRLTKAPKNSIYPVAAFGPEGEVGILFRDDRLNGEHHVFFMRLGCVTTPVP
jgi:hypothetical protein